MKTPTLSRFIRLMLMMPLLLPATLSTAEARPAPHLPSMAIQQNATPAPASPNQLPIGWRIETITHSDSTIGAVSLALDAQGQPHITFSAGGLYYAKRLDDGWHFELIEAEAGANSLVLDANDQPHLSYGYAGNIIYARKASQWISETVGSGSLSSLALDSLSHPHIAAVEGGTLKYMSFDGSQWQEAVARYLPQVDNTARWISRPSLNLNAEDQPYIGHVGYTNGESDVSFAAYDGLTWTVTTALSIIISPYVNDASFALDTLGQSHIAYTLCSMWRVPYCYGVYYAYWNGQAWIWKNPPSSPQPIYPENQPISPETPSSVSGPERVALALDQSNNPQLAYSENLFDHIELRYKFYEHGMWQSGALPVSGDISDLKLAVDQQGNSHLVYAETGTGNLIYARRVPFSLNQHVEPALEVRANEVITYSFVLNGAGLEAEFSDPLPPTLTYVAGSVTPPAVYSPTLHAILWQGTLPTTTVQTIQFQATANISDTTPSAVIYNTAWLTDQGTAQSVSASSMVNGYRMYLPLVNR